MQHQVLGLIQQVRGMIFKYFSSFFPVFSDGWRLMVFCLLNVMFLWFWSGLLGSVSMRRISDINDAWVLNIKSQRTKEPLKIRFNLPASCCLLSDSHIDSHRNCIFFFYSYFNNNHQTIKHFPNYGFVKFSIKHYLKKGKIKKNT